jgi:hypothetical protein
MTEQDYDPYDLEYLRSCLRRCMRADPPKTGESLGHQQALRGPGQRKLKRPAGVYLAEVTREVDGELVKVMEPRRKPAHGQWSTIATATATRPPGFSRECISDQTFANAKYMRALYGLSSKHILVLQALYSPSRSMRESARRRLINHLVSKNRVAVVRQRGRLIAKSVLLGRSSSGDIRTLFGMSIEQWRRSSHRAMLSEIRKDLAALDSAALVAWGHACKAFE